MWTILGLVFAASIFADFVGLIFAIISIILACCSGGSNKRE